MDVTHMNPVKRKLEWMLKTFNLFYKLKMGKSIKLTLEHSGNPIVKKLHEIIMDVTKDIKDHKYYRQRKNNDHDRYRRLIIDPAEFALGIYYTDSAWRDIGTAVLYRILMARDELLPLIEADLKNPEHYYYNVWEDFQGETLDDQAKGNLPKGIVSESEAYMVDSEVERRIDVINEQKRKNEEKHRHW